MPLPITTSRSRVSASSWLLKFIGAFTRHLHYRRGTTQKSRLEPDPLGGPDRAAPLPRNVS
jgi:hypothetical protein